MCRQSTEGLNAVVLRLGNPGSIYTQMSPIGRNVLHCSLRYGSVVRTGSELNCHVIRNFYWQSVSRDDVDKARIVLRVIICSSGELSFV